MTARPSARTSACAHARTHARAHTFRARGSARAGVTLIELLVTLVILGLLAGVTGMSLTARPMAAPLNPTATRIAAARDAALRSGHPVSVTLVDSSAVHFVTALPVGRVLTDLDLRTNATP